MQVVPDKNQDTGNQRTLTFIEDLNAFASDHKASRWSGTFAEFLNDVVPSNPRRYTRISHQYIYDVLCWYRNKRRAEDTDSAAPTELFTEDLFGIDSALDRVVEYFKAASAGSDIGRRLLLLLGPPSGG